MPPSLQLRPSVGTRLKNMQRLIPRLQLAHVLSLPEESYGNLIQTVESHPLFQKYLFAGDSSQRLFGYRRYPRSGLSSQFFEATESAAPGTEASEVEELLEGKKELIDLCRRVGQRNFETFLLYNDGSRSLEELSDALGLSVEEIQKVMDLLNRVDVLSQFHRQTPELSNMAHSQRIARIERDVAGQLTVGFTSLRYARGRYHVDYTRWNAVKNDRTLTPEERHGLQGLIKTMELVNARKSTMNQILECLLDQQGPYLSSGEAQRFRNVTQKELAVRLAVHASTVCRAISGKSVVLPWEEETPLKNLFGLTQAKSIQAHIDDMIAGEEDALASGRLAHPLSDEQIRSRLWEDHRIRIALRTVAKYRHQLRIPNVYEREKALPRSSLTPALSVS